MGAVGLQVLTPDPSLLDFAHLGFEPLLAFEAMMLLGLRVWLGRAGAVGCVSQPTCRGGYPGADKEDP